MPYYHVKCGGEITFWTRKCKKCGHKWPISSLLSTSIPEGMTSFISNIKAPEVKKGKTTYASWADRFPGVGLLASKLPSWPRWLRILSLLILVGVIILIIILIRG